MGQQRAPQAASHFLTLKFTWRQNINLKFSKNQPALFNNLFNLVIFTKLYTVSSSCLAEKLKSKCNTYREDIKFIEGFTFEALFSIKWTCGGVSITDGRNVLILILSWTLIVFAENNKSICKNMIYFRSQPGASTFELQLMKLSTD